MHLKRCFRYTCTGQALVKPAFSILNQLKFREGESGELAPETAVLNLRGVTLTWRPPAPCLRALCLRFAPAHGTCSF